MRRKTGKTPKHAAAASVSSGEMESCAGSITGDGAAGHVSAGRRGSADGGATGSSKLEGLVRTNTGWLRGWFRGRIRDPELVDDLVQEAFLRALRGFSRLRDPSRFSAWLYRTAENLLRDHFRRKSRRGDKVVFTDDLEGEDRSPTPDEKLSRREEAERLLAKVESLPDRYREPLLLRHARELPYSEIGAMLGISENSVRVRIFRARQELGPVPELC